MNIFALHPSPAKSARWHADKHVVKMLLESVQLLYTAHWVLTNPLLLQHKSPMAISKAQKALPTPPHMTTAPKQLTNPEQPGYRPVHIHHPCAVWARQSQANYNWLCSLALFLALEFRYRWPTTGEHSCEAHAMWLATNSPPGLAQTPLTQFVEAMPDIYKRGDPIKSYRAFYKGSKTERGITNRYTHRHKPHWLSC
jgi:hypothetical protein